MSERYNFEYDPTSPHSPEDQASMDFLVYRAREILERSKIAEHDTPLTEAKEILNEEAYKEGEVADAAYEACFVDPEGIQEAIPGFQKYFGWNNEQINEATKMLRQALDKHYHEGIQTEARENEPEITPMPKNSTRNQLLSIIAHDFGIKKAENVSGFVDAYIRLVRLAKGEENKEENENEEM